MLQRMKILKTILILRLLWVIRNMCLVKWQNSIVQLPWRNRGCSFHPFVFKLQIYSMLIFYVWLNFRWYEWWEKSRYFVADSSSSKPPFVIVSSLLKLYLKLFCSIFPPESITETICCNWRFACANNFTCDLWSVKYPFTV